MLFKAIAGTAETPAPAASDDFWYAPISTTATGIRVNAMSAMRASACYACVMVIAQSVASLPRMVMERMSDGTVMQRPQHPLQDVLDTSPNDRQTAFEYWEMQTAFGCLFGNAYSYIQPGPRGAVDQLIPLRPDCMRIHLLSNGKLRYSYTDPFTGKQTDYLEEEIFKIPGFSFNGIEGIAPIVFGQDPIGLALATEQFGAKFFSNDATPSLVLEHPKSLSEGAAERIKKTWKQMYGGLKNAYSVAVLEEDMKVHTLGVPNKDAQFLETRKYQIAEIARYMRVPLHMINELEKSSFSNIESLGLEFVRYTLRPWLRREQQRIQKDLMTSPKFTIKHDLDDLLKGEMLPRYQAYQIAATVGFLTRNEIRKREGDNPLPGLDDPLTPMNMDNGGQGGADNKPKPSRTPQGGDAKALTAPAPTPAQVCAISLVDAFDRIVKSEEVNVTALAAKHHSAPEKLPGAVKAFYATKHAAYVAKTLLPSQRMAEALGIDAPDSTAYAAQYAEGRTAAVLDTDDIEAHFTDWMPNATANLVNGWLKLKELQNAKEL